MLGLEKVKGLGLEKRLGLEKVKGLGLEKRLGLRLGCRGWARGWPSSLELLARECF